MMKKQLLTTLALLTYLGLSLALPVSIFAQDEEDNKTLDNIKKVIQEKKVELSTGAATMRRSQAYLAEVIRVNEGALTVQTHEGQNIIPLEEVAIEQDNKEIETSQLSIGSWVGIFKKTPNTTEQQIEKVVVYKRDFSSTHRRVIIGSIQSIGRNDISILPRGSEEAQQFNLSRTVTLQDSSGETVRLNQFFEDLQCLVIATEDKDGNYVISTMRALSDLD
jgi:hypothetical protein